MVYEILKDMIKPELLTLVPVLYLIGMGLKKSVLVKDKYIPLALGGTGVILSCLYLVGSTPVPGWRDALLLIFSGITQGVLAAGASVYVNQVVKQAGKTE